MSNVTVVHLSLTLRAARNKTRNLETLRATKPQPKILTAETAGGAEIRRKSKAGIRFLGKIIANYEDFHDQRYRANGEDQKMIGCREMKSVAALRGSV